MWIAGVVGISSNVTLYFAAMRGVPESHAGANLVNYLWPILTIVFCAIVFRQKLGAWQWLGMIVSFAGAASTPDGTRPGKICSPVRGFAGAVGGRR